MKPCENYMPALSAFADGELNAEEKAALLAHLEQCEACRERLSELMILHTMLEELPELDAPDGFSERVLARIHEDAPAKKKPHRRTLRTLAACAAVVLIVGAARVVLPGKNLMGNANDTAAFEMQTGDASPDYNAADSVADTEDEAAFDTTHYSVQYDGSNYGCGGDAEEAKSADDSESPHSRSEYLNVRVDDAAAAEFLSVNGMSVYAETEESVSFLVTPAVAHALAGEGIVTAAEADALNGATELMVVEIPKDISAAAADDDTTTPADADSGYDDNDTPSEAPEENELPVEGEVAE